ncbi:MAG: hypothetical protein FWC26_07305 [Fibromonadales bacterium]|nr:hypothetical protein [Fibromonadales bacterium]
MKITIFVIICCFCIFACKSKDESKEASNTEKPLNLSLLFHESGGMAAEEKWTIKGKIMILLYPYSIDIINDSIIIIARQGGQREKEDEEYRGKLTNDQYLEIKKMISSLKPKYDPYGRRGPFGGWTCILKVDNQILYEYKYCCLYHPFSKPEWPPMPEEIELLFKYIVGLSPFPITYSGEPNVYPEKQKKYCLDSLCVLRHD